MDENKYRSDRKTRATHLVGKSSSEIAGNLRSIIRVLRSPSIAFPARSWVLRLLKSGSGWDLSLALCWSMYITAIHQRLQKYSSWFISGYGLSGRLLGFVKLCFSGGVYQLKNFSKLGQTYNLPKKTIRMELRLEKICSVTFAFRFP